MGGWLIFVWGIPCGLCTLVFLKLVANCVALTEADLKALAEAERRACEKRNRERDDEVAVVVAVNESD
ncbi:MAG: hypothetical protein IID35_03115 [Planctomycetes bacterium]|nr:hypothetical protein [Planctomycetota bacterium]MCH7632947.1 hypothetical protein [Planctomycetota bacterium]